MWTSPLGVTIGLGVGLRHTPFPCVRNSILRPVESSGILNLHAHQEVRSESLPGKTRLTSVLGVAIGITRFQPQVKLKYVAVTFEPSVTPIGEAVNISSIRGEGDVVSSIHDLRHRHQRPAHITNLAVRHSLPAPIGRDVQDLLPFCFRSFHDLQR